MLRLYFCVIIYLSLIKISSCATQIYAQIFLNLNQTIIDLHPNEQCKCYMLGTQESAEGLSICSPVTLQCKCLPHVGGLNCDKCEQGFYNIQSGKGCTSCDCDANGTLPGTFCDQRGRCKCKKGFKGFRCNLKDDKNITDFYYGKCHCQEIILSQLNTISTKLVELCKLIGTNGTTGNESFQNRLNNLKQLIKTLLIATIYEKENKIKANFSNMIEEISKINQQIENLGKEIPSWKFPRGIEESIGDAEKLIRICHERFNEANNSSNHNEELTSLAQKAIKLAQQLKNLPDLMEVVVDSYHDASESINILEANLQLLKESYANTKEKYNQINKKLESLLQSSRNNKQTAIVNKKLLDDVWFPFENAAKLICYYNLTDGSFVIPEDIEEQLNSVKLLQLELDSKRKQFERLLATSEKALKENREDIALMKTIFKNFLKLIDKIDIDEFLEIESLSNTNKNELKILENEFMVLLQRLEHFIKQIRQLNKLNDENETLLQEVQELLSEYEEHLNIIKELEIFFNALPLSAEELDSIEDEITKAEKYFALLEEKEKLEQEVKNVEAIVKELDALGDVRDLCDNGVKPEGLG